MQFYTLSCLRVQWSSVLVCLFGPRTLYAIVKLGLAFDAKTKGERGRALKAIPRLRQTTDAPRPEMPQTSDWEKQGAQIPMVGEHLLQTDKNGAVTRSCVHRACLWDTDARPATLAAQDRDI